MSITFGAEAEFLSAGASYISVAWLGADKFVAAYGDDSDSGHGTARVGTVSGTAITFGAEAEFLSAGSAAYVSVAALSTDKFVVAFRDGADGGHGTAKIGTVSGTSIAFGAEAEFASGGAAYISAAALSATAFVVAYYDIATEGRGKAKVGTVSGTAIAFGAAAEFASGPNGGVNNSAVALSPTAFAVAYKDGADSGHGTAKIGTVSGTSIAFGAEAEFASGGDANYISAAALSSTAFVVAYRDETGSSGTAKVGTVSGTAITFGAEAEFLSSNASEISVAALSGSQFAVAYKDGADSGHGTAKVGTVSGTSIAFGAEAEFLSANGASYNSAAALSGTQFVVAFRDGADSNHGTAKVGSLSVAYSGSLSDSMALSDAESAGAASALSDSVALSDSESAGAASARSDSVALSDAVAASVGGMGAAGLLDAAYVVFYHPLDDFTEYTQGQAWAGGGALVSGKVGGAVDGAASMAAHTPAAYPTAVGATRVAAAMWAKLLTAGSSVVTVERGYRIDVAAAAISLGGAVWSGPGIAALMAASPGGLNDGLAHMLVLDFENAAGTTWRLRTSLDGAPWVDQGAQTSGSQVVATADTAPRLAVAAGGAGQWIDELVLWAGDKDAFALFATEELANLQDLADVFGAPMDQYQEYFGAPICWQATARMPDGSAWRDSGPGPCPPVVRVPRGASDVVVTDDGAAASPRVVEG